MDITNILNEIDDVSRLCQRFLLGRADFGDLASIRNTIHFWTSLKNICGQEKAIEQKEDPDNHRLSEWDAIDALLQRLTNLENVSERIENAIIIDSNGGIESNDTLETNEDIDIHNDPQTLALISEKPESHKGFINPQYVGKCCDRQMRSTKLFQGSPRN